MSNELIGVKERISAKPVSQETVRDRLLKLGPISTIQVRIGGHEYVIEPVVLVLWGDDNPRVYKGWWHLDDGKLEFRANVGVEAIQVLATYTN